MGWLIFLAGLMAGTMFGIVLTCIIAMSPDYYRPGDPSGVGDQPASKRGWLESLGG